MVNRWMSALVAVGLLAGLSAFGDSELDGKASKAGIIVKKLDPKTNIVTTYKVDSVDDSVKPANLEKLSKEEQKAKVEAFLKSVEKPENKIAEEKVEKLASNTELDKDSSTAACGWRWRGYYGGYYGAGFYGNYGYNRYYYQPYYNYNAYYGYYGYGCNGYYNYSYSTYYYPTYTVYGCGW